MKYATFSSIAAVALGVFFTGSQTTLGSLVGYYTFEEGRGTTTADISGFGTAANGTLAGAAGTNNLPQFVTPDSPYPGGTFALDFDGTDDLVNLGNPTKFQITGALTVSAWINVNNYDLPSRIVAHGGNNTARGWGLAIEGGGFPTFQIGTSASTNLFALSPNVIPLNQWVNITGVYEPGTALRLYVNGVLDTSNTTGIPVTQFNANRNALIGARADSNAAPSLFFHGRIDEVRIYNEALDATAVAALAVSGKAPFQIWRESHFNPAQLSDPAISGPNADPENDGISNLLEYALALDPLASDTTGLPTVGTSGGHLSLTYRKDKTATDIMYTPQAGETLAGDWSATGITEAIVSDVGNLQSIMAVDPATISGNAKRFMRLNVTLKP